MVPLYTFKMIKGPEMIDQEGFQHDCHYRPDKVDAWSCVRHGKEIRMEMRREGAEEDKETSCELWARLHESMCMFKRSSGR